MTQQDAQAVIDLICDDAQGKYVLSNRSVPVEVKPKTRGSYATATIDKIILRGRWCELDDTEQLEVVIHEACHLLQMNHGPRFKAHVRYYAALFGVQPRGRTFQQIL